MSYRNDNETGRPVEIKDEGITLVKNVASIDFTGGGVAGTNVGDDVTEDITSAGDVAGPGSAVDSNFASFDTTTGKLLKDSGSAAASFAAALGVDDNYVTDAEKTVIGNTSNTNTGDETQSTIKTK